MKSDICLDSAIAQLQAEIDHKAWYMTRKKQEMSGPYGSVFSPEYRRNRREEFKRFQAQIKTWKKEIAELNKQRKAMIQDLKK